MQPHGTMSTGETHKNLSPIPALKWMWFAAFDSSWHISSSMNFHHYFFWSFSLESISLLPCFSSRANHCGHSLYFWYNVTQNVLIAWSCSGDWQPRPSVLTQPHLLQEKTCSRQSHSYQARQLSTFQKGASATRNNGEWEKQKCLCSVPETLEAVNIHT